MRFRGNIQERSPRGGLPSPSSQGGRDPPYYATFLIPTIEMPLSTVPRLCPGCREPHRNYHTRVRSPLRGHANFDSRADLSHETQPLHLSP